VEEEEEEDALISKIYFGSKNLHVSDSSSVLHQELFTVHSAMVYVIQVCRQLLSRIRTEQIKCYNLAIRRNISNFTEPSTVEMLHN
jgi:hypothetical protein